MPTAMRRPAAPSRPRLALAALLAAGALAPLGCADKEPTGIVLVLDSQSPPLGEPRREIDHIQIDWEYNNNADTVFGGSLLVGQSGGSEQAQIQTFPGTLTFQADPDTDSPTNQTLSLTIVAYTSTRSGQAPYTITRKVKATFADQKLLALPVTLEMGCLAAASTGDDSVDDFKCDQFSTCIVGKCQQTPILTEAELQPFNEGTYAASYSPAQCFNASSSDGGCFQGASRVPASGLRFDTKSNNIEECDFDIASDDPEELKRHLNVAVVWPEGNGRATTLDFIDSPSPSDLGWTATAQLNQVLKVNLPSGVCNQLRLRGDGRVSSILYARSDSCSPKPPLQVVCPGSVPELDSAASTCEPRTNIIDPRTDSCPTCLRQKGNKSEPLKACLDDAGCQFLLSCRLRCLQSGASEACISDCNQTPTCDGSLDRAKAALPDAIPAAALCKSECQ